VETVLSADWEVDREGMINLKHPRAQAAGVKAGLEPIQVYFHALRHPTYGLYVVDTGVEHNYRDAPEQLRVSWLVRKAMDTSTLKVRTALGDYLHKPGTQLKGVLLTHLHLDHIMGLPDVERQVPIYVGPGEAEQTRGLHAATQSTTDWHLEDRPPLQVLQFQAESGALLHAVADVFGDGSLWAIWVPGHTAGSVAYLARTPSGTVLMTGDACHTRFGWEHQVEPGSFSADVPRSAVSLDQLGALVKRHPGISVRLGHQHGFPGASP
jgi:N-acyl homoserine lactone hydrolase